MKNKFSKTFLKNIERFEKQKERMLKLKYSYETHTTHYYAKNKRHNLLGNEFSKIENINPYKLTNKQLNQVLRDNSAAIKSIGFNSSLKGDYAEGLVLVALNNEAYDVIDFLYEDNSEYWDQRQADIMGEILFDSLKNLRLTNYQLNRILSQSSLPIDVIDDVKNSLLSFYQKLRK